MSQEVTKPIAGGEESPVEKSNITASEFAQMRAQRYAKPPEKAPEEAKPEEKTEPKEPEKKEDAEKQSVEAPETKEPEAKEVHSKEVDLEAMTEAELKELGEKLGSRAVSRFGELTAKRKAAEEQLAALKAELAKRQEGDPLSDGRHKDNPYKSIKTVEELQAKTREVDEVIEWADEVLWNSDHLGADDVVANVEGKELTKASVRKALRDAQKARREHLPAQFRELQAANDRKALKASLDGAARKELEWMGGEDNDVRKQYEALNKSPVLRKAIEAVPELEPYVDYLVAHAANSIYGRKSIEISPKVAPAITPPSTPKSSIPQPEKQESRETKKEADYQKRFKETSDVGDFIALRTAQLTKRKSL